MARFRAKRVRVDDLPAYERAQLIRELRDWLRQMESGLDGNSPAGHAQAGRGISLCDALLGETPAEVPPVLCGRELACGRD